MKKIIVVVRHRARTKFFQFTNKRNARAFMKDILSKYEGAQVAIGEVK